MQCQRCGKELGNDNRCTFCGYDNVEGNVREMTNIEKNFYDGITIETGDTGEQNSYKRKSFGQHSNFSRRTIYTSSNQGFFSRIVDKILFGLINNEKIAKIAMTLIAVAVGALMFFVALPILFLMLAVGIALFVISKLGR
jgi:hypothetical protein